MRMPVFYSGGEEPSAPLAPPGMFDGVRILHRTPVPVPDESDVQINLDKVNGLEQIKKSTEDIDSFGRVSMEYVKTHARAGLDLRIWAWLLFFIYLSLFGLVLCLMMLQNYAGLEDNRHLKTALTQTAGLWTSIDSPPRGSVSISGDFTLTGSCSLFSNGAGFAKSDVYLQPVVFSVGTLDSRYIVLGVLASATIFQFFMVFNEKLFYGPLRMGNNHFGSYLERTISIPLVVAALSAQSGLTDLWVVVGLMLNTWGCVLFSFFAEVLFQGDCGALSFAFTLWATDEAEEDSNVSGINLYSNGIAHYHSISIFAAWGLFAVVFSTIQSNFSVVSGCFTSPLVLSGSMIAVVYVEMGIFFMILLCQTISLMFKLKPTKAKGDKDKIIRRVRFSVRVEYFLLVLDFLVKFVLCILFFIVGVFQ